MGWQKLKVAIKRRLAKELEKVYLETRKSFREDTEQAVISTLVAAFLIPYLVKFVYVEYGFLSVLGFLVLVFRGIPHLTRNPMVALLWVLAYPITGAIVDLVRDMLPHFQELSTASVLNIIVIGYVVFLLVRLRNDLRNADS